MTRFASGIDSIVSSSLPAELSSLHGFERVHPRRWVGSAKAPIREIFEFKALKGATYSARWGFSLDFVPFVRGGRVRWKRTPKNAEFDVVIDPIDELGTVPAWCSFFYLPNAHQTTPADLTHIAASASAAARNDFDRVRSISDIVALFSERASMSFRRFSLENYVQTQLAWGLAFIAVGESERGDAHVKEFCKSLDLDRGLPAIRKAEREAEGYARSA